jgi:hydrogenase-4 membrane subunit HyfE
MHLNINQFFYAFGAGLVLAYVYVKSGKYFICVILHSAINTCLGVVVPYISSYVFTEEKHIWTIFNVELLLSVLGLILFVLLIYLKKLKIKKSKYALEDKTYQKAFFNPYAIIFCVANIFLSLMVYM